MPDQNTDAEAALQKLGHRVRLGWAKKHPVSDKSLESVKNTMREQWEQEQTASRTSKPAPSPEKDRGPKPPEPGLEP
jgi:hypothetical protein